MKYSLRIAALLLLGALMARAQTDTATLAGNVTDPSDAAVPGAKVQLINQATGATRSLQTDDRGAFYFTLLPAGRYELTAEAPGFKQFRDTDVELEVAQSGRLAVRMEVGVVAESVEVQANVSPLNTETAEVGTVVTGEKVVAIPLNGRQFMQLTLLVPNANSGGRQVQQNIVRSGEMGGLSIAGGRTNNTLFLVDGAVDIDPDYSAINYSPTVDGIAEFQVQTAMAPAEYPRATINVVTKSGTNAVHGDGWEFLRNNILDARPYNLPGSLPQFQRNQFGATLGGPIIKDRLLGFFAYEGLRVNQAGASLTTVTLPTALERQGIFTQDATIKDPTTGLAFQGNRIPSGEINPESMAALSTLPLPTAGNTYVNIAEVLRQHNDNYSGRLDSPLTEKWNLFARFSRANENANVPFTVPARSSLNDVRSTNTTLGATTVVAPNLLNEARLGFSHLRWLSGLPEPTFDVNGSQQHLPQIILGGSYPLFGGAGAYNATNPGGGIGLDRDTTYQAYDNFTWTHGPHAMRFGASIEMVDYVHSEAVNSLGAFQFTGRFTGNQVADFLLALPATASRALGPNRLDGRQWIYAFYGQDDYRIRPNLTLNLGLRYELQPPMYSTRDQLGSIDYSQVPGPLAIFASGKTGFYDPTFFVCGQSGYPKGCAYTPYNNVAPRIGLAWSAAPKTVIRAGFGMFYVNIDGNTLFKSATSLPANLSQSLSISTFSTSTQGYNIFGPGVLGSVPIQQAGMDLHQRTGYSVQWDLAVQRQITNNVSLEAGYVATTGVKLEQNVQPNNAMPGVGTVDPRRPYFGLVYAPGTQFPPYLNVVGNSVQVEQVNYYPHSAHSTYESGYLRLDKRFTQGLSFLSSYTFSKALTNAPQYRNAGGALGNENSPPQNSFNLAAEKGLASFDARNRWVNTLVYDLPFGKQGHWLKDGWASKVAGGFEVSSIFTLQSGFPFTVNLLGDTANIGGGTGGIFVRPNLVLGQTQDLPGSQQTTKKWFNTGAFLAPPIDTFGNVGRNTVSGPGLVDLDFVLQRNFTVTERARLQFRFEVFDALNHPNFNIVDRIFNDPAFGSVQSQFDPRELQFGLKVIF